jgi:hypothetical protein
MVPSVASKKIPSDTTGDRSRDSRLVAQCLNHYATLCTEQYNCCNRRSVSPATVGQVVSAFVLNNLAIPTLCNENAVLVRMVFSLGGGMLFKCGCGSVGEQADV